MTTPDRNSNVMTQEEIQNEFKNITQVVFVYAFFDKKSNIFDTPFYCRDNTFAQRHYTMVSEKEGMMARFKEDFDMYLLGSFNYLTGEYVPMKQLIVKGVKDNEVSNES
jgi:hypothetical protein